MVYLTTSENNISLSYYLGYRDTPIKTSKTREQFLVDSFYLYTPYKIIPGITLNFYIKKTKFGIFKRWYDVSCYYGTENKAGNYILVNYDSRFRRKYRYFGTMIVYKPKFLPLMD